MHEPVLTHHPLRLLALALAVGSILCATGIASAASGSTTVTVTFSSATNIDASGCTAGTVGKTDFGTLLPSQTTLATADCSVIFGSSNDTSMLRVAQDDALGVSMFGPSKGTLDTGFDTDGKQTTTIGGGATDDFGNSVAVQADNKTVVSGLCYMGAGSGFDICLTRYTTSGALDTTFDTDGKVTTAVGPAANDDYGYAVAIQSDGKIVVAGLCDMEGATQNDSCVLRYTAAGALDTTFDTDGIQTTAIAPGANTESAVSVAIQPDGKIVTAGACDMGAPGNDLCLARYTAAGALDTTFDTDGKVTTSVGPGAGNDYANAIALQADGKILVSGLCDMGGPTGSDMCVVRYTSTGALDTTFDSDGIQTTSVGLGASADPGYSIAVQPDGKIVVGGACFMGAGTQYDLCLVRYTSAGALDATFDSDGKQTTSVASGAADDTGYSIALQPDGKILIAGDCAMGGATGGDICMARFSSSGGLDTSFDLDGKLTTSVGPGANTDAARSLRIRPDGQVIVVGYCDMGGATAKDFCVANYAANGTFSDYVNATTDWDTAPTTNMFGACLQSVSGGAAGTWTVDPGGACTAVDTDPWNDIPITTDKVAYAASAGTVAATANLRFGLRTSSSQPPGTYLAPITFDVVAPNA